MKVLMLTIAAVIWIADRFFMKHKCKEVYCAYCGIQLCAIQYWREGKAFCTVEEANQYEDELLLKGEVKPVEPKNQLHLQI